ncbi:MAG: DUF1638 domain-containing protein [Deltaproteobacteria bacterium]|jgi:hypothetical protein|nr:DUF1638 domain-containing protein [Deltaproteobacteria bacterium]
MVRGMGVVACDVIKRELERVIGDRDIPLTILDYALHGTPKEMAGKINAAIAEAHANGVERVALGYGLCSNGVVGVESSQGLVIPRCHDCISLLLGSPARYYRMFNEYPGTYFLTDGWFRNNADPLSTVIHKYIPRLGEKKAFKGMNLELANYKYVCLVNNGIGDLKRLRALSLDNAKAFNKEFFEIEADLGYFEALISGQYPESDFIALGAREKVHDSYFYQGNALEKDRAMGS